MNCKNCPLNIDSKCFKSTMLAKVPLHFRNIFICNDDCANSPHNTSLCGRDLWVLTFIGQQEKFAMNNAVTTMVSLVKNGFSELLCNLFENAPYEKRREMWLKMTTEYSDRLYMFDSLFEKECLAPIKKGEKPENLFNYQNSLLFPQLAYEMA